MWLTGLPQPSTSCARGDHDGCPHFLGGSIGLWRLRPRKDVLLCADACHRERRCPMAGRRRVRQEDWDARCTCPGADPMRRSFARSEERRRELADVMADVDLTDHPDAATVERRLREAFAAHGHPLPPLLPGMSRMMAAGRGTRGTRTPRLLWMGLRAAARAVRWAAQAGTEADAENRRSLRRMYAALAALVGVDVLLSTAAVRSRGWWRLPWTAAAVVGWLFTTRVVALGAFVTWVARRAQQPPGNA